MCMRYVVQVLRKDATGSLPALCHRMATAPSISSYKWTPQVQLPVLRHHARLPLATGSVPVWGPAATFYIWRCNMFNKEEGKEFTSLFTCLIGD